MLWGVEKTQRECLHATATFTKAKDIKKRISRTVDSMLI